MKYIILDEITPVIFGSAMAHDEMARRFPEHKITSAGFIGFIQEKKDLRTFSESSSLKMGPSEFDAALINHFLGRDK